MWIGWWMGIWYIYTGDHKPFYETPLRSVNCLTQNSKMIANAWFQNNNNRSSLSLSL